MVKKINKKDVRAEIANRLNELLEQTDISARSLSALTGISYNSMVKYVRGDCIPYVDVLIKLADWFAVPLDYFCGRCDEETSRKILENYSEHFMELRRASFEEYLKARPKVEFRKHETNRRSYEYPYPYNLLAEIEKDQNKVVSMIDSQTEHKLVDCIDALKEEDSKYIISYFKQGLSIDKIAKQERVSKQWVMVSINRALKRLKFIYQKF